MAAKPLTTEAIALTEKKMDMSLDDIIKMSKTNTGKSKKPRASNKSGKATNGKQDRSLKVRQYLDSRSNLRQGVLAQKRSNFQGNSFPLVSDAAARKAPVASFRNGGFNRNRAINWSRPRAAGPMRRQGNASFGGNGFKQQRQQQQLLQRQQQQQLQQRQQQQQHQQQQQPSRRGDMMPNQKPKTLDSLFANMKEQRMKAYPRPNNGSAVRSAVNQPRQPWLRGRFGNYRN